MAPQRKKNFFEQSAPSAEPAVSRKFPDPEKLLPHQLEVINDPHRFKVLVWHRRARKTTTAITETVRQAAIRPGIYWHIFPTYGEAKDAVWRDPNMLFSIIPPELIVKTNESELVVYLESARGKSVFQLKGADDPDALRGPNPYGIVFDEFEKMKPEAWGVSEPILRANDGWAWFIGTPQGKNHFWEFYQRGLGGRREWKSWLLKASTSGIIRDEELKEARMSMSEALYNQEFECEFQEGVGQVFRGVREVCTAVPQRPFEEETYVVGVDLAKHEDWTVIVVYNRRTNAQVYQDRFQTLEWPFQKAKIKAVSDLYNRALVVLDATGLGDPIADDLIRAGVPVEPMKFTEGSKKEMVEKLSIFIEQKHIKMIPMEETVKEFDNFSYYFGPTGRIRYGASRGTHDDIVIAHALAVWQLSPVLRYKVERPRTLIQSHYERAKRNYDNPYTGGWWEWEQDGPL